jgi:hypothetical protein
MTEWHLQGRELVNCNCDYGCPCQFAAPPTHGNCEVEARTGRIQVAGVFETVGEPIVSPATGSLHRASIHRPEGVEYRVAEMGSASTIGSGGDIALNLTNSYGQFAHIHLNQAGVVD